MPTTPPNEASKHRRNAKGSICTNCRQHKLKCDAMSTTPQACSRCRKHNLQCVVDSSFRRQRRKDYTQSLETEIKSLQRLHDEPAPETSSVNPGHVAERFSQPSASLPPEEPLYLNIAAQSLGTVSLPAIIVHGLIENYFTTYHPLFPILPEKEAYISEYKSNKLLLWAVLAIASYGNADSMDTYFALVDPVRRLAADLYGPQSRSLKTMQALILLCVWPFPFQQTINDPSPMYCSLATHIGFQLGLHRPLHKADFDEHAIEPAVSDCVERKTWHGCFIVNQGLALRLGVPPTLTPGYAILKQATEDADIDIPASFQLDLNIALSSYQLLKILGDDDSVASGQYSFPETVVSSLDTQWTKIKERFPGSWPATSQISFNALQLQAYSFLIAKQPSSNESLLDNNASQAAVHAKVLSTIVRSISEASKEDSLKKHWPFFPKYHVLSAATFGLWIAGTTSEITVRLSLIETCRDAANLLKTWSLFPKDQISRVSGHILAAIELISSTNYNGDLFTRSKQTPVISRMAANIPYMVIWSAKHRYNPTAVPGATAERLSAPTVARQNDQSNDQILLTLQQQSGPEEQYNQLSDLNFFGDLDDTEFTDIFLDWQSLKGITPEWA